jgi:hypothetical protein
MYTYTEVNSVIISFMHCEKDAAMRFYQNQFGVRVRRIGVSVWVRVGIRVGCG